MQVSSCVVQVKKMYIVVCVATLTSRVTGFHAYKKQVDIGIKLHCELEPENSLCRKAIVVKTKEGDAVGHVPDLLAHALAPEISGGNIEGTWVIGGGIETPCKYLVYADKKLKSKIRTMLRKASI